MSKKFKRTIKQGLDKGSLSGMPAIEIEGQSGGLRLTQTFGEKQRIIYLDADSTLDLVEAIEDGLKAQGYDRAWMRHYRHVY